MAQPRVQPVQSKPLGKTLNDFPAYIAERNKLNEVTAKAAEVEAAYKDAYEHAARETGTRRETLDAQFMLAGNSATVVKSGPSLEDLSRECRVLAEAVRIQTDKVEQVRVQCAKEISVTMVEEHHAILDSIEAGGKEFLSAYARLTEFKARFAQATGGGRYSEGAVRDIQLPPLIVNQFKSAFDTFTRYVHEFR